MTTHHSRYLNTGTQSRAYRDATGRVDGGAANDQVAAVFSEFERIEAAVNSLPRISERVKAVGRMEALVDARMCDLVRVMIARYPEVDPVPVLRNLARMPRREAERIATVARALEDLPKVAALFARGDITLSHVEALVMAASQVSPEAVEADDDLLQSAIRMVPD